uniref:V-type proton ATPase subunit C n=1 Tax=Meloidogyne hapla TaxID=6305 RepID=A0A1I8B7T6_MELHA
MIEIYMKFLEKDGNNDRNEDKNLTLTTVYNFYLRFLFKLSGQELIEEGILNIKNYKIIYIYFIDEKPQLDDSHVFGWNQNFEEKFTKIAQDASELFQKLENEDEKEKKEEESIEEGKRKNKWKKLCLLHNFVYSVLHVALEELDNEVFFMALKFESGIDNVDISERDNYDCNSKGQVKKVIEKYSTGKRIRQIQFIHKINIEKFIKESNQMRYFLCYKSSKSQMIKLVGVYFMITMDQEFPEILKIHKIERPMSEFIYKTILRMNDNKISNENFDINKDQEITSTEKVERLRAELRINISILLNKYIEKTEKLIKENSKNLENKMKIKNAFDYFRIIIYEKILEADFSFAIHIL